jgi:hypothetical protein
VPVATDQAITRSPFALVPTRAVAPLEAIVRLDSKLHRAELVLGRPKQRLPSNLVRGLKRSFVRLTTKPGVQVDPTMRDPHEWATASGVRVTPHRKLSPDHGAERPLARW